jgi:hypothetical protein
VPLLAAFDTLLDTLDGDVRRYLPTSWGKTKFGSLTTASVLGGDAAQLLGGVPENVTMFALAGVPCATFRSRSHILQASLLLSLGLGASAPSP